MLSAFLIAVYPNLMLYTSEQVLCVLERIAVQTLSYTMHSNILNSTVMPAVVTAPPFQASTSDVLTNALWFASLTVSLVTASFGMLVK